MKRRDFSKLAGMMAAAPMMLNTVPVRAFASKKLAASMDCSTIQERCIVVIRLAGANDGFNTIVPVGKYDRYAALRPDIRIPDAGLQTYLPISGPTGVDQVGFNPVLEPFRAMYDNDMLNIVQGVSYPQSNRSHFKATDLMLTGGDGLSDNFNLADGWMGRYLENAYPEALNGPIPSLPDPLGLQMGGTRLSLGFHTDEEHEVAFNLAGQDPGNIFQVFSGLGGPPPAMLPDTEFGAEIDYVMEQQNSISVFSERLGQVYNQGTNLASYPDYDLANQFKTVARLLNGGVRTKIFLVEIGGWDTHADQVAAGDVLNGRHAVLLKELSESVQAFYNDLDAMELSNRVLTVSFSEFGRKAEQNGNLGCDHGTVGPMFVFGPGAKGGVTGATPDLDNLVSGAPSTYEHDYRSVFGSLLVDWLGADDAVVNGTGFAEHLGDKKLDLIDTNQVAGAMAAYCHDTTAIGEAGRLGVSQPDRDTWHSVNFVKTYIDPIVVMSPVSRFGQEPAMTRVRNVTSTGFEFQISKWNYLSASHPEESVGYMVVEAGAYTLPGGRRIVAGKTTTNRTWKQVDFAEPFEMTPVVISQVASVNDIDPCTTRNQNVDENGFQVKLREEQTANQNHLDEDIHFVAVEPGLVDVGGLKAESGITGAVVRHQLYPLAFNQPYAMNPVFIADIQGNEGGDTCALRIDELDSTSATIFIEEEQSKDLETNHVPESVGFVVFECPGMIHAGEYVPAVVPPAPVASPVVVTPYPKPFSNELKIKIEDAASGSANISIVAQADAAVYYTGTVPTSTVLTIPTTGFPAGFYIVNVQVDGEFISERVVKVL